MKGLLSRSHAHRHGAARGAPVLRVVVAVLNLYCDVASELDEPMLARCCLPSPYWYPSSSRSLDPVLPPLMDMLSATCCRRRTPRRAAQAWRDIELYAGSHDAQQDGLRAGDGRFHVLLAHHLTLSEGNPVAARRQRET